MALLVPNLRVTEARIEGCAPWLTRAVTLFSFSRCVTVDRGLRHVIVESRHLWMWRRSRVVSFGRIARIVFRAQLMPGFSVSLSDSDEGSGAQSAVFFIALALEDPREEVQLFTVWERQPRPHDVLDRLAGVQDDEGRLGDEQGVRIVTLLRQYLGVPIARN